MNLWIKEIEKYHKDWLRVLYSFGADYYAEDIVQEMYITLMLKSSPDKAFREGKVYFPYIYRCLRNSYLNYALQKSKVIKVDIDELELSPDQTTVEEKKDFEEFSNTIRDLLTNEHWYYEKLYDVYTSPEDPSFRKLEKDTTISFMTIYGDFKKIREIINNNKEKLQEKWNDL